MRCSVEVLQVYCSACASVLGASAINEQQMAVC